MLRTGGAAPEFTLADHDGTALSLRSLRGRRVFVYFYPKADTPGCTTQACGLRDVAGEIGDTVVVGISPDAPARLRKFRDKYDLGFTLLSDADHAVAEAYGVWVEKKLYGQVYFGVERSAFLVGADGTLEGVWYKVKPGDTPLRLLEALQV